MKSYVSCAIGRVGAEKKSFLKDLFQKAPYILLGYFFNSVSLILDKINSAIKINMT